MPRTPARPLVGACAVLLLCWMSIVGGSAAAAPAPPAPTAQQPNASTSGALVRVAAAFRTTCGVTTAGTVLCWGQNFQGALGIGQTQLHPRVVPTPVPTLTHVTDVVADWSYFCALIADGGVWCWGDGRSGGLGTGRLSIESSPVKVVGLPPVRQVSAGGGHTCAVTAAGAVWCWGAGFYGALGNGSQADSPLAVPVTSLQSGVAEVAAAYGRTCARTSSGTVWCWGANYRGDLGNGQVGGFRTTPVRVVGLTDAVGLSAGSVTCAVRTTGGVVCWGSGGGGLLGNGTKHDSPTPSTVIALPAASSVVVGPAHACAVTTTGRLSCWGSNLFGMLGIGTAGPETGVLVPTPVLGLDDTRIGSAAVNTSTTCATTTSRRAGATGPTTYCWGRNRMGQLGTGDKVSRSLPSPVVGFS